MVDELKWVGSGINLPVHTAEIVPDEIHNHEVLGLLFGRLEQLLSHRASCCRRLLDSAFDGSELDCAASRPGEEAFGTAAHDLDGVAARDWSSIVSIGANSCEIEIRAERCWVRGAEAQV